MADRTSSSSDSPGGGNGAAWASLVAGLASVATLPIAVYVTRFSETYELLHAGFAIPVAGALALVALALARRARRRDALRLGSTGAGTARAGQVLGIVGICLAASALVSLGVYGLLEYVGSRN